MDNVVRNLNRLFFGWILLLAALLLAALLCAPAAALPNYTIADIADPQSLEDNVLALNQNLIDFCAFKADLSTGNALDLPLYIIQMPDSINQDESDSLTLFLSLSLDDIFQGKADVDPDFPAVRTYLFEDLLNPAKSEENTYAINEAYAELERSKADK